MKQQSKTYIRIPFWLDNDTSPIFCCIHLPKEKDFYSSGVVICNPLGFEYTHSHRTIRHLADQLATAGFPTIRFDYHGTGDSDSDLLALKRLQKIMENIDSVVAKLKDVTDVKEVCLIGIRLGATFAAKYASEKNISNLVLWSPCTKGRSYVREMQALAKLASHSSNKKTDFIDSGGFILTDETAAELSKVNLLKLPFTKTNNILLIERDDIKGDKKLIDSLLNNGVKSVEYYLMSGYADMMAEPQETVVPFDTIDAITEWLSKTSITTKKPNDIDLAQFRIEANASDANYKESLIHIGEDGLVGILTSPKNNNKEMPLVVLANSGSVHRVGPNRVYVELARGLANSGVSTVRFDLRNLGDSVVDTPLDENSPYPHMSTNDINLVVTQMKSNSYFKRFVLAGLCSGAHNVFHTGLEVEDTSTFEEVMMINPLAFYRRPDAFIDNSNEQELSRNKQQYIESVFSLEKWKKFFSKQTDKSYIIKFVSSLLWGKIRNLFKKLTFSESSLLSKDLLKYKDKALKITFVIASKDPGKDILMSQAKKVVKSLEKNQQLRIIDIEDADHTFTTHSARQRFVSAISEHAKNWT